MSDTTTTETFCVQHERPETHTPYQWKGKCRKCGRTFCFAPETSDPRNERRVPGEAFEPASVWSVRALRNACSSGDYPDHDDHDEWAVLHACMDRMYPELRWDRMISMYARTPYAEHVRDMAMQRFAEGDLDCPIAPTREEYRSRMEASARKRAAAACA